VRSMVYEYRCMKCGAVEISEARADRIAGMGCCGSVGKRVYSFSFHRPAFDTHFNHATGKVVANKSEFADALKQKSEEAEARTGIPANYVPIDYRDKDALGVTDEGLETK
jgi:hypothetical protein